ncbi:MAG: hypothetical protein ACREBR_00410, partial [bacterium]
MEHLVYGINGTDLVVYISLVGFRNEENEEEICFATDNEHYDKVGNSSIDGTDFLFPSITYGGNTSDVSSALLTPLELGLILMRMRRLRLRLFIASALKALSKIAALENCSELR